MAVGEQPRLVERANGSVEQPRILDLVRITEAAALASAHLLGHGDNTKADQAAVEAMRRTMDTISFAGRIVIGEGERDEAPMLFIGEHVGQGDGAELDIAVDPLEGTNLVAKGRANAIAVLAAVVAGTAVHVVMGIGGAPEGVLAAAALKCVGAEILGRLKFRNDDERRRAKTMGITDEDRVYRTEDLAPGKELRFIATGVTDGDMLRGVRFFNRGARTHSIVLDHQDGKLRFIDTTHFEDPNNPPLIRLN